MRQGLVALLAAFAVLGMALPVLASQPAPGFPSLMNLGPGIGDSLPTNGDDDNSSPGNGDDDDEEDDQGDEADDEDDEVDEDDEEDDEDDEDEFELEERRVEVNITDDEVSIKLESKSEEREDEVKVQFEAPEGEMKVSFETEAEGEEEVEMRIALRKILEFNDTATPGRFSLDDEVVQSFDLDELTFHGPFLMNFTFDGNQGRRVNVTYDFPGQGNVSLVFWIFGNFTIWNGVPVRPTEVKIDILINDFPYEAAQSALAIDLRVRTEFEMEVGGDLDATDFIAQGEAFSAFFNWTDTATVDTVDLPVNATIVRESLEVEIELGEGEFENETRLFLSYPRGVSIVHDPKVGIMRIAAVVLPPVVPMSTASLAAYVVGLGTAILLVLGVWALNRRRT